MNSNALRARILPIRLVAMDCDGVLTDGGILLGPSGEEIKRFHAHDGHGIVCLHQAGIETAVITGRTSGALARRAAELGMKHLIQGCKDKAEGLRLLQRRSGRTLKEICYIGDDLPDIPALRRVGFAVAVSDARPEARAAAHWVARARGGCGAVRETAEKILKVQGRWRAILARGRARTPDEGAP